MSVTEMVALASLALNVGIALVGATWGISKIRTTVREEIDKHRDTLDEKIDKIRLALDEKIEQSGRHVGESLSAVRTKIHEIETWARDTFVRRESFDGALRRQESSISGALDKIDKRLDGIDRKIDGWQKLIVRNAGDSDSL